MESTNTSEKINCDNFFLDNCDCSECIIWNAPLCQLCFINRCNIKTFPEYEEYCNDCIILFVIGSGRIKIKTTKDNIKKLSNSIFNIFLEDSIFKREHKNI